MQFLLLLLFAPSVAAFGRTVLGCMIPGPQALGIGEIMRVSQLDKIYECRSIDNGEDVELIESIAEDANCDGGHLAGETWIENKSFKYHCAPYGVVKFVSCMCPDMKTEVFPNTTVMYGRARVTCTKYINGTVTLDTPDDPLAIKCMWPGGSWWHDPIRRFKQKQEFGKTYEQGMYFTINGAILVQCMPYGRLRYLGCYDLYMSAHPMTFGTFYELRRGTRFCLGVKGRMALLHGRRQTWEEWIMGNPKDNTDFGYKIFHSPDYEIM